MARPPVAKHRPARAAGPGAALTAYRLLTDVVRPAVPFFLGVRARRHKEDSGRRAERLGHAGAARPEGVLVWVHAASVGETNAILPLLSLLRERVPELRFLLTTGTVTSAEVARRRLREPDIHQFAPLDAREYVCRFLDHWRPALAVFTESEIWPNLVLESAARGLPLALVNARMSDSSFRRWRRLRRVCRQKRRPRHCPTRRQSCRRPCRVNRPYPWHRSNLLRKVSRIRRRRRSSAR